MAGKKPLTRDEILINDRAAQRLMREPEIVQAFEDVQADYLTAWSATELSETERREALFHRYKAVGAVLKKMQIMSSNAHKRDIDAENERKRAPEPNASPD